MEETRSDDLSLRDMITEHRSPATEAGLRDGSRDRILSAIFMNLWMLFYIAEECFAIYLYLNIRKVDVSEYVTT